MSQTKVGRGRRGPARFRSGGLDGGLGSSYLLLFPPSGHVGLRGALSRAAWAALTSRSASAGGGLRRPFGLGGSDPLPSIGAADFDGSVPDSFGYPTSGFGFVDAVLTGCGLRGQYVESGHATAFHLGGDVA